jgi:hypothetical protein
MTTSTIVVRLGARGEHRSGCMQIPIESGLRSSVFMRYHVNLEP